MLQERYNPAGKSAEKSYEALILAAHELLEIFWQAGILFFGVNEAKR